MGREDAIAMGPLVTREDGQERLAVDPFLRQSAGRVDERREEVNPSCDIASVLAPDLMTPGQTAMNGTRIPAS